MRIRPTATVSGWLSSVAEVLPLPHRAAAPYTLGEAVAELGAYAQAVGLSTWNWSSSKQNRHSLRDEIEAQSAKTGRRLSDLVASTLEDLRDDADPQAVVAMAARLTKIWHSEQAVTAAFRDLCDAAQVSGITSRDLRELSAIIASQVGAAARAAFSPLSKAADVLVNTEGDLALLREAALPNPLMEAHRLDMARDILVAAPAGRVVVWTAYYRATTWQPREVAGPITFLQADWALPNAFDLDFDLHRFPERAELREIREKVRWLDELNVESLKPENRLVVVRVDLGNRQVAGAVEEARRRVDAILSVAIEAGGVSWRSAGVAAVLLGGEVHSSSLGLNLSEAAIRGNDDYGMRATAEILSSAAEQLDVALTKGPMPDHLVEALSLLREARMTDHRDVLFYGARRVTPRLATALEDHAMELFASVLNEHPKSLAKALQRREALTQADRRIAGQLMAPLSDDWSREHDEGREKLKREISEYDSGGTLFVSIPKAVALQDELRALSMPDLQRADLEEALAICIDPDREQQLLNEVWSEAVLLRARLRRVRNAINHGLPLDETTLNSVRDYAASTSTIALHIALTWFKNDGSGATLLQQEETAWNDRIDRIGHGLSWAAEAAKAVEDS